LKKNKKERKKERIIGFAHVETDPRGGGYCNIASPHPPPPSKNFFFWAMSLNF